MRSLLLAIAILLGGSGCASRPDPRPIAEDPVCKCNGDLGCIKVRVDEKTPRSTYKGQTYLGRVEGGALVLSGKRFDSPSAAAVSITRNPVNGWRFWEARLPGQAGWKILESLRKSAT